MDIKHLGEICTVVSGGTPARSKIEYWQNGDIPWMKIGNIKGKYVDEADEFITKDGLDGSSAKMLPKGTILYTIFATLGEVGILTIDACTNQAIAGITIKEPDRVLTDYLYYFLKSKKKIVNGMGRGVAQNNINMSILRGFEIPLPSMIDQKRIVDILDRVTNIIDKRQNELMKLDELIKARFVELFGTPLLNEKGWNVVKAEECCLAITDGSHFSPQGQDEGYPMLSVKDMRNDGFHYDSCKMVSKEDFLTLKKQGCVPQEKDVLISKDGSYFCYGFVLKEYMDQAILSSIAMLRPDLNIINPYYLCNYMLSERIVGLVSENYVTGAALKRVILKGIKQIPVMLPPIELQNEFESFVKQVDKSKTEIQKSLKEAQTLFDSLMQQFFG